MCIFNEDGSITLETGETVKNSNLKGISKEGIDELYEVKMPIIEGMRIQETQHQLLDMVTDIQVSLKRHFEESPTIETVEAKIDSSIKAAVNNCLTGSSDVEEARFKSIDRYMKKKLLNTKTILSAVAIILGSIITIYKFIEWIN